MSFETLIALGIGVACYFVILGIVVLYKWCKNKKNFKQAKEKVESSKHE